MEILAQLESLIADQSIVVAMLAIVIATLVSEDLTCIACGLLVTAGQVALVPATAACIVGLWFGDLTLYGWGHFVGRPALKRRPFRWWFTQADVDKCAAWYKSKGPSVIYLARIVPGCRLPTYFAAGLLGAKFWRFNLHCFLACLLWAPLLIGLAILVGEGINAYFHAFQRYALVSLVVALVAIYVFVKLALPMFTYRGRRLLRGAWRRKVRWEYWPSTLFYVPIVVYILWLAIRYRSLSLFTTVNPAIFAGGFVNESKSEILDGLTQSRDNLPYVVAFRMIEGKLALAERLDALHAFREEHRLDYPVVLKPDAGQRGSGVAVVRSDDEAAEYLESTPLDIIAQEYAPGAEFGIFYYRFPNEERGTVFSITEKKFPHVVGDGERTLEALILERNELLPMARFYFDKLGARLFDVPADGERIQLVEIGNHCRGAIFLDGKRIHTPELEAAFDAISRRYEGFFFGRYDLRTPDVDALARGENFKIVELNGATSEATHIYDPRNSLVTAYRTLFEQWKILFGIASQNRANGVATVPLGELAKLVVQYRHASKSHPA